MPRRTTAVLLVAATFALLGCRPDTVHLGFGPEPGATYRYRYEIEATITRQVEDEQPRTTQVQMTIESTQTVLEVTDDGARLEVTLTSAGALPLTAVVLVDRAGSLQAIQEVDGLPAEMSGLPTTGELVAAAATEPPTRALAVGDRWNIAEGSVHGDGRVDHLAMLDGASAAVIDTTITEVLSSTEERDGSQVVLDGELHTSSTTAFALSDGSVRRSRTSSEGTVDVLVSPPLDVLAPAVEAVVTYELDVTTTRLD